MSELLTTLASFSTSTETWVYFFIFFGKIAEVSISTLRIVLINRGERLYGSFAAIFEITLWLFVTGTVLSGFTSDFIKVVVFIAAFVVGNYLGSVLDEKLAFGLSSINVFVTTHDAAAQLTNKLRESGFGVTVLDAKGNESQDRYVLMIMLKRKLLNEALNVIRSNCENAVVSVSDVKAQKGGYFRNTPARPRHNAKP